MKRSPIKQVSAKKRRVIQYRTQLRKRLIDERGNICELNCSLDCRHRCEGLHELLKQSAKPFVVGDTRDVLLSCNQCNGWVEDNPIKAHDLGLTVSRYG